MAKNSMVSSFELTLKSKYDKAECTVSVVVDSKSLPNQAVLGEAMEKAVAVFQEHITRSYDEVPPRPVGDPPAGTVSANANDHVVIERAGVPLTKAEQSARMMRASQVRP